MFVGSLKSFHALSRSEELRIDHVGTLRCDANLEIVGVNAFTVKNFTNVFQAFDQTSFWHEVLWDFRSKPIEMHTLNEICDQHLVIIEIAHAMDLWSNTEFFQAE